MENKRYGALDGLRMLAAFGIVMMHMRANNDYVDMQGGCLYNTIIPSFTNFVFLFMVISAFGMCCGYYDKILHNKISMTDFYKKRFVKVLPFFTLLVMLDVVIEHSMNSIYEGFADITLLFGLLPNAGNISVIGVGWFLGLVFVFYLMFPFFCVLLENKKRAWIAFVISLVYNFVGTQYFNISRNNILYSGCFFIAGGLLYLYREQIAKINKWILLMIITVSVLLYYLIGGNTYTYMVVSVALVLYAMVSTGGILDNKVTKFFSDISMEIYLSHMVIFRIIEKLKLSTMFGKGWLQYSITVILVLTGATVFSVIMKKLINKVECKATTI